jgi:hypothetical protein
MGIIGPKEFANQIKENAKVFLDEVLALTLSEEKTMITNIQEEKVKFLGTEILIHNPKLSKVVTRHLKDGRQIKARVNHVRI